MMNEPRVYKNSPFLLLLIIVIFGIVLLGIITALAQTDTVIMILFAVGVLILLSIALLSMTSKTIISDDEIATQTILGTKTLRWNEIHRVSGRGYGIKLHNFHGDVIVFPSSRLPRYEEIIEWIGSKRPDLFNPQEYSEMPRNWLSTIFPVLFGLIFMGLGIFIFIQEEDTLFPVLIFSVVGLSLIGMFFSAPKSVRVDGNAIVINYIFSQKTLSADEISFITLSYTQTRNGKVYFIAISLKDKKTIRVSGLRPSLPIAYLALKNWHKKNTTSN